MENEQNYGIMLGRIATLVSPWCEKSESTTLEAVECLLMELTEIKMLLAKEWMRNGK